MNRKYVGTVVGIKNLPSTISVSLEFVLNHQVYHKTYVSKRKKQVHVDGDNVSIVFNLGDMVEIESSRPYSATKRFRLVRKIEK